MLVKEKMQPERTFCEPYWESLPLCDLCVTNSNKCVSYFSPFSFCLYFEVCALESAVIIACVCSCGEDIAGVLR